jgi:uncharacterized protein YdaU (DUF1376 family)
MQSPSFQFYVQDFLTGTNEFTAAQVGGYLRLLCYQWDKGALPNDDKKLLAITHVRVAALEAIKEKFVAGADGLLRNPRLERERNKQMLYRQGLSDSGKKGMAKRWDSTTHATMKKSKPVPTETDKGIRPPEPVQAAMPARPAVVKRLYIGQQAYDSTAAALTWERYAQGIAEMMTGCYSMMKLEDVWAEIERQCPSGTVFTNDQHLLNKFRYVADRMLAERRSTDPVTRLYTPDRMQVSASSRLPISNL